MFQDRRFRAPVFIAALMFAACDATGEIGSAPVDSPEAPLPLPPFQAADSVLLRLTKAQYRNSLTDIFGEHVVVAGALESDNSADHSSAVGAGVGGVSSRGVELYEAAAVNLAEQVLAPGTARDALMPCTPAGRTDATCARAFLSEYGRRLWRRPLSEEELVPLVTVSSMAAESLDDFYEGLEFGLVGLLTSPNFLYRVELGEENPQAVLDEDVPPFRFTSMEMASRLSYFLWNTTPDDALLAAAEAGELVEDEALEVRVRSMLDDPRAQEGMRAFFTELLELESLSSLAKDPDAFPHIDGDVGPSAREETLLTIEQNVFVDEGDFRDVFTTRTSFINHKLASIYNVAAPQPTGFAAYTFPEDSQRAGILTQVAFLALNSHVTATSATLRGRFVRVNILCGDIPPPPANVNTSIPEPTVTTGTLRDRLAEHRENLVCASCHALMDPIGLGFENFDALGRFRLVETYQGIDSIIDPNDELDGVPFANAVELAHLVRNHPDTPRCLTRNIYKYATGHIPTDGEQIQLQELLGAFAASGYQVKHLLMAVALSEGFRTSRGLREAATMEAE